MSVALFSHDFVGACEFRLACCDLCGVERRKHPKSAVICHACNQEMIGGCVIEHEHWMCIDADDIRACPYCDGYVHKYCAKNGVAYEFHEANAV